MLVRMTVGLSGPAVLLQPGDEHDFPQAEALRLVDAGFAVPVAEKKVERAVAAPITERRGKRGKNVVSSDGNGSAGE